MSQTIKEAPLLNVKTDEIRKFYDIIYAFFIDLEKSGRVSSRNRIAVKEPSWAASEIIYLALHGYTKKTKFSKVHSYIKWSRCPKSFYNRIVNLLGAQFRGYIKGILKDEKRIKEESQVIDDDYEKQVKTISYTFKTDDQEVQRRMKEYIDDFDLHSSIDKDILKNLVKTQMLIESSQDTLLRGEHSNLDVKSLTEQLKNYTTILGLSKKDRVDLGSERKKGTVAELTLLYEQTLQEYPELEEEFLLEELNMLLDKYERMNEDGDRELSAKAFKVISGGYTLEEALEMTGRKRRNVYHSSKTKYPSNT